MTTKETRIQIHDGVRIRKYEVGGEEGIIYRLHLSEDVLSLLTAISDNNFYLLGEQLSQSWGHYVSGDNSERSRKIVQFSKETYTTQDLTQYRERVVEYIYIALLSAQEPNLQNPVREWPDTI